MHISTKIVGARHRSEFELKIAMALEPGDELVLIREATNPYDANAIRVEYHDGDGEWHLGYIPRTVAEDLAPAIDNGSEFTCVCSGHNNASEPSVEINEVETEPTETA